MSPKKTDDTVLNTQETKTHESCPNVWLLLKQFPIILTGIVGWDCSYTNHSLCSLLYHLVSSSFLLLSPACSFRQTLYQPSIILFVGFLHNNMLCFLACIVKNNIPSGNFASLVQVFLQRVEGLHDSAKSEEWVICSEWPCTYDQYSCCTASEGCKAAVHISYTTQNNLNTLHCIHLWLDHSASCTCTCNALQYLTS